MADPEDESPTESETRSSVTRGIASLFMWNQVLVIASLFLAMLGVNSLMTEVTITKIAISVFLLLLAIGLLITSADFFVEGAKGLAVRGLSLDLMQAFPQMPGIADFAKAEP